MFAPWRSTAARPEVDKLSFEDALAELEQIVRGLESGQQKLEDAITAYERGAALRRHCEAKLAEAEARVAAIVQHADVRADHAADGVNGDADEEWVPGRWWTRRTPWSRRCRRRRRCALHGREDVVFVDLRDPRELEREGRMPGAFHCTRGMLEFWIDPESPYHKPVFAEDKRFVFFCAGGWRSALAAKTAQEMGLKTVAHIERRVRGLEEGGGPGRGGEVCVEFRLRRDTPQPPCHRSRPSATANHAAGKDESSRT